MRYPFAAAAAALATTCGLACLCQAQITATERAHQGVTTALKNLADDELSLKVARAAVDRSVKSTPQWTEAEKARAEAQARFDEASKAATQSLQNSPDYKAALEKRLEAEQKRDSVRHDPTSTPQLRLEAASEVLVASSLVTRLERDAAAADPAVAQAKIALAAANAKLAALRQALEDKYKDDKDVQAAQKRLEDDKTALADAKKELAFRQSEDVAARNAAPPPRAGMLPPPPVGNTTSVPANRTAK